MDIKDVQNLNGSEIRSIRINIRITPSQNKFIVNNNLSITKIMNEALKQLGYVLPKPEEIPDEDKEREYDDERVGWKSHKGRGDRVAQRRRWKSKQRFKQRRY
ncbi:hypothetical protein HY638_02045 [Candidatus Woesearchaeota archaeon]|nr:hypothetical protein [Candidatus Woesearchaeota archaeon]